MIMPIMKQLDVVIQLLERTSKALVDVYSGATVEGIEENAQGQDLTDQQEFGNVRVSPAYDEQLANWVKNMKTQLRYMLHGEGQFITNPAMSLT